jgi:2-phospho-L-lactate guanylyltransferase (CobY/MobA/RfbA family)
MMNEKSDTITIRELRSGTTTKRILAGERLALRMGRQLIADIVPRGPADDRTLDEILAPVKAAAQKSRLGKNLILEDRKRFRR